MLISPTHPASGKLKGVTQLSGLDGVYDVPSAHSLRWSFELLGAESGEEVRRGRHGSVTARFEL